MGIRNKFVLVVLIVMLLLVLAGPALAQDVVVTVPAVPVGDPATSPEGQAAQNIFAAIYGATYLPFAAGLVALLVGLSKRIPLQISGPTWTMLWTVAVWAAYAAANHFGFGNQFSTLAQTMTTIGAMVLGVTITPMAAGKLYSQAVDREVALVGYQRTKPGPNLPGTGD